MSLRSLFFSDVKSLKMLSCSETISESKMDKTQRKIKLIFSKQRKNILMLNTNKKVKNYKQVIHSHNPLFTT